MAKRQVLIIPAGHLVWDKNEIPRYAIKTRVRSWYGLWDSWKNVNVGRQDNWEYEQALGIAEQVMANGTINSHLHGVVYPIELEMED